jgi:nucleosome binding factor SPN SPT16 subunit
VYYQLLDIIAYVLIILLFSSTVWNGADCLLLHRGPLNDDDPYQKSGLLHHWLFGYELPDTIILLRKDGNMWILATKKKCDFLKPAADAVPQKSPIRSITFLLRSKDDANAKNYDILWKELSDARINADKRKIGTFVKEREGNIEGGGLLGPWEKKISEMIESDTSDLVDISAGVAYSMIVKDPDELDLMKKASVLANKVMKHGYVKRMEEIIDREETITHETLASYVEEIIEDPSKISLKVSKDDVQSCYYPIVQSGGAYDIRVSAQSTSANLSPDVIMISLGARFCNYCSNISRTFLVDAPKKVSDTYKILLEMQDACLAAMIPGNPLKAVYKAAVRYLQENDHEHLVERLPKNLGFASGLDFRESSMLLTPKNTAVFKQGMVFCLAVGFQDLELSEADRSVVNDKSPVSVSG